MPTSKWPCADQNDISDQSAHQDLNNDTFDAFDTSDMSMFSSASDSENESSSDSEDEANGMLPDLTECAESIYSSLLDNDSELFSDEEDTKSELDIFVPIQLDPSSPPVLVVSTEIPIPTINCPAEPTPVTSQPDPAPLADGMHKKAPNLDEAKAALIDLTKMLFPQRKTGPGYKDPNLNPFVRERMQGMAGLLSMYTNSKSTMYGKWIAASQEVAIMQRRGETAYARRLRTWACRFIKDRTKVPANPYGKWNKSQIEDEDLSQDILQHLQSLGPNIRALDIVNYLNYPDVRKKYRMKKGISEQTARKWLQRMGFRWTLDPKGQYVDGHERPDVVDYRQKVYISRMLLADPRLRTYSKMGEENTPEERDGVRRVVIWYHDESVFYAHDRRKKSWVHKDAGAAPYKKGEGHSLMVADFVSADYGWLRGPDGRSARRLFRPGKKRDGWFTNEDILEQIKDAIALVKELYPHDDHIFVYDNATTHLKRPVDAPSARNMPKNPNETWGVEINELDANGKKKKIRMAGGMFDGKPQSFYFPEGHSKAGWFKGMATILEERGISTKGLNAQCKDFKCKEGASDCCCRRILYNQADFVNVKSTLEITCEAEGTAVVFLPKFHCELNPIEQCWGYAKRIYRMYEPSSQEADLERNVISSLASIPLSSIRRFANRSRRFMDAYNKGLDGKQAAWASRKYRGHRVLPASLMDDMEKAKI